jgi:HTH-type transcriptional regulator/antitoxin HigA
VKRIDHRKDHAVALKRLEMLILADPAPGSPEDEELNCLAKLIALFEKETIRIPRPSELELLRFRMEQRG